MNCFSEMKLPLKIFIRHSVVTHYCHLFRTISFLKDLKTDGTINLSIATFQKDCQKSGNKAFKDDRTKIARAEILLRNLPFAKMTKPKRKIEKPCFYDNRAMAFSIDGLVYKQQCASLCQ